jgi:branched-chain amino acid transport system ATP-binding protein
VTDTTATVAHASPGPATAHAVHVDGVDMRFAGLAVLNDIQLEIPPGSAVAVVGPNGSGKTTLLNIISGIYRPVAGRVHIGGREVTGYRPHRIAHLGVGRTFQHIEVPKELTVLRVAMLGRHTRMNRGVLSYALGIPHLTGQERAHRETALAALRLVGADQLRDHRVGDLPYGLAKRVDLARALAAEPQLLLLDEPAAGLNDRERDALLDLLVRVKAERDLTLVVVEHDMSFITELCERVVVLVSGSKVYDGESVAMHHNAAVVEALLGTTAPAEPAPPAT